MPIPHVSCLLPVEVRQSDGRSGKAVIFSLSTEEISIRTGLRLDLGDTVALSGAFDWKTVRALAIVQAIGPGEATLRLAATTAEGRAEVTRYVYRRLGLARPHPRIPDSKLEAEERELTATHKLIVQWVPRIRDTDRHLPASDKWIERSGLDPEGLIAPRA